MSNIVIKNFEDFDKTINNLEEIKKRIEEIFNNQNNNFDNINETEIWTSKTQKALSQKYDIFKIEYDDILVSLQNYINFMRTTLNNYKELDNKLNEDQDNNDTNLDVN